MGKKFVNRDSLGEALHVGLRKGCDSKITTAAYKAINLMPNVLWAEFLDCVWEGFQRFRMKPYKPNLVWQDLKTIVVRNYDIGTYYRLDREQSERDALKWLKSMPESMTLNRSVEDIRRELDQWRTLFKCILEAFSTEDWKGFACFLYYESERERA